MIEHLKALALAATPGPWKYSPMTETEDPEIGAANGSRVAALVAADMTKANSAYIAAANPAVTLKLLKRLARVEARVLELETMGEPLATITLGGIDGDEYDNIDIDIISSKRLELMQRELVWTDDPVLVNLYARPDTPPLAPAPGSILEALEHAMAICDAVPSRLHESDDTTLAHLGLLVNAQGDGTHGYAVIRDALVSWRGAMQATPELPAPFFYYRANADGSVRWEEDCVCQDDVYSVDPSDGAHGGKVYSESQVRELLALGTTGALLGGMNQAFIMSTQKIESTLRDWQSIIHDNELGLGDRLQRVSSSINVLLNDAPASQPAIVEQTVDWNAAFAAAGTGKPATFAEIDKAIGLLKANPQAVIPQFLDASIDIETLSTRPNAAVISIGIAVFDRRTGEICDTLYREVHIDDAVRHGHVDGHTLAWWMKQGDEAKQLFSYNEDKKPLSSVIWDVGSFLGLYPEIRVWGNGSTFDITILEMACINLVQPAPWKFQHVRDMRTIVDAAAALGFDKKSIPFDGVPHNALDDAMHQACVISACWRAITETSEVQS